MCYDAIFKCQNFLVDKLGVWDESVLDKRDIRVSQR